MPRRNYVLHVKEFAHGEAGESGATYERADDFDQKKRILSEVFFSCENCEGPLVQHTFCRICKKTDLRICLRCNHIKPVGDHRGCLRMLLLDMRKIFSREDDKL